MIIDYDKAVKTKIEGITRVPFEFMPEDLLEDLFKRLMGDRKPLLPRGLFWRDSLRPDRSRFSPALMWNPEIGVWNNPEQTKATVYSLIPVLIPYELNFYVANKDLADAIQTCLIMDMMLNPLMEVKDSEDPRLVQEVTCGIEDIEISDSIQTANDMQLKFCKFTATILTEAWLTRDEVVKDIITKVNIDYRDQNGVSMAKQVVPSTN